MMYNSARAGLQMQMHEKLPVQRRCIRAGNMSRASLQRPSACSTACIGSFLQRYVTRVIRAPFRAYVLQFFAVRFDFVVVMLIAMMNSDVRTGLREE